nr:kinesin-like protein KIN-4A [Tanacetum cinerariifolium]
CLAAGGNTFPELKDNIQGYVAAAAVNYNQGNFVNRTPSMANEIRPPGFAQPNVQNNQNWFSQPQGELKAITTRSGIVLDGHSIPIPPPFINSEEDERVEETLTDQDLAEYTIKLHINITLADALILIPKYQKMLKGFLSNKEKLLELANTPLNKNCSAVILKKLPEKLGDPGKFLISCGFNELKCKALADLVGKFTFPVDFVIVDYESDPRVPLILGIPFLRTARALIDVHGEEMILRDGDKRLTLNMRHDTLGYSNQPKKESINMINICDNSSEDFLEKIFTTNHQSGNPTFSSHPKLTSSEVKNNVFDPDQVLKPLSPSPIPVADSDSFLEKSNTSLSLTEYETSFDHTEETNSGSTITHADYSLPKYDSFLFEIEPDQGKLTSVIMKDNLAESRVHVSNVLTTHPALMLDSDFIPSDNSLPEYEIFYFDIEENNSGSTTIHADISLLDLESFNFDFKPDPSELTSIVDFGICENVPSATNVNLPPEKDHSPLFAYVGQIEQWVNFSSFELDANLRGRVFPILAYANYIKPYHTSLCFSKRKAEVSKSKHNVLEVAEQPIYHFMQLCVLSDGTRLANCVIHFLVWVKMIPALVSLGIVVAIVVVLVMGKTCYFVLVKAGSEEVKSLIMRCHMAGEAMDSKLAIKVWKHSLSRHARSSTHAALAEELTVLRQVEEFASKGVSPPRGKNGFLKASSLSHDARSSIISSLENMLNISSNSLVSMGLQFSEAEERECIFSTRGRWNQLRSMADAKNLVQYMFNSLADARQSELRRKEVKKDLKIREQQTVTIALASSTLNNSHNSLKHMSDDMSGPLSLNFVPIPKKLKYTTGIANGSIKESTAFIDQKQKMVLMSQLSLKKLAMVGHSSGKLWRWKRGRHQWIMQFKWKRQEPWRRMNAIRLRKRIQHVHMSAVGIGVMGYIGNKGSMSVSMSIYQTLFCFIDLVSKNDWSRLLKRDQEEPDKKSSQNILDSSTDNQKPLKLSSEAGTTHEVSSSDIINSRHIYDATWAVFKAMQVSKGLCLSYDFLERISHFRFNGLSGEIRFKDGKLTNLPTYNIINVIGGSYKDIEYWLDLVAEVHNTNLDAAVDNIKLTTDQYKYAEFSQPYMETRLEMMLQ